MDLISGLRRFLGEGNDNPLQYSCLGNPTDRGAWWATVHEVAKESDMTEWLNNNSKVLKECMKIVMNVLCPTPASVHFGYVYMTIHGWQGTKLCPVSWMLFCLSLFSVGPKASFSFLRLRGGSTTSTAIINQPMGSEKSESVSRVQLFVTPWTEAHQALLSMEFFRQEYWVGGIPFFRGSSQPRDWTWVSCIAGRFFTCWATREAPLMGST